MNRGQYISKAVVKWFLDKLSFESDLVCQGLPEIDVQTFFKSLGEDKRFPQEQFSIAVDGFHIPRSELLNIANKNGLTKITSISDDLNVAAEWRNNRSEHPRIIALASGYPPGVHTLGFFASPQSSDLAIALLEYAIETRKLNQDIPDIHSRLLNEIAASPKLSSLRSVGAVAKFLEHWDKLALTTLTTAPCYALPSIGLLTDPKLFEDPSLAERLETNLQNVAMLKQIRTSFLGKLTKRVLQFKDVERKERILNAIGEVRTYLRGHNEDLTLEQALDVIRPPSDTKPQTCSVCSLSHAECSCKKETSGGNVLSKLASDSLLDGEDQVLIQISDGIDEAWDQFQPNSSDNLKVTIQLPTGDDVTDEVIVDRSVLEWGEKFCSSHVWGGLIETTETKLSTALARAADGNIHVIDIDKIASIGGVGYSMLELFRGWDTHIKGETLDLVNKWGDFVQIREQLLPHVNKLLIHAREWISGRPNILLQIERYLVIASYIYNAVQENYDEMKEVSSDWARLTLESLLALDVLQVRVNLADGKEAAKAILMPTHPLHLWRNEKLSTLLAGLAKTIDLKKDDREVICNHLRQPEQFLSVIRLGSVPNGVGLDQLIPLSGQISGLPIFENLINACSGLDGVNALIEAVDQYITLNPNHPYPLRVAIINPPRPEALLSNFVRLINDPRYRGGQRLSAINISLYATAKHKDRLDAAKCFAERIYEDVVQEKVASGKLDITINEIPQDEAKLSNIVNLIRSQPVHIIALFDESTIHIRSRGAGNLLPMSPFCVRQDIRLDRLTGTIELKPQPGQSPFAEFSLMISMLEGTQRDSTHYAHANADALALTTDQLLQGDASASRWLFLADRALPPETGMSSVKIWERREGQRDTFLAARDFSTLARLLRPVFSDCNLTVSPEHMSNLLREGARLLGSGLLGMIKKQDGKPDKKLVIGFAGLILASRDIKKRYPGSLVLSVDHPVARLWLKTGTRMTDDRCDLLVLRKEEEKYILTAVEVKSSLDSELSDYTERIVHAKEQVAATLDALRDALSYTDKDRNTPLSIPRIEMLKVALTRAAQSRSLSPAKDTENRKIWGEWLVEIFEPKNQENIKIELEAEVVCVTPLKATAVNDENTKTIDGDKLIIRTLGEKEVQELIIQEELIKNGSSLENIIIGDQRDENVINEQKGEILESSITKDDDLYSENITNNLITELNKTRASSILIEKDTEQELVSSSNYIWPPPVNKMGMIGQDGAVEKLVTLALYSKNTKKRFSDLLLVGPAGVGKSTVVRKVSEMLLGKEEIFFSGTSLKHPKDLIDRLLEEDLIPKIKSSGKVVIKPCIVFIDETHGISKHVATALLSATDDKRITTIDVSIYDFNNVVFFFATTDKGELSEAFQSRTIVIALKPYTLHELAGIIWLHGKMELDGAELSKDACYEIAARCRCNPRKAIRELKQIVIPHFYAQILHANHGDPTSSQIASLINPEAIAQYYDKQGVDQNGLDELSYRFMNYLRQHGSVSESGLGKPLEFPTKKTLPKLLSI